jgi:flagellar basal-body rod protein FlgC
VASNLANADSVASSPQAAYRSKELLFSQIQQQSLAGAGTGDAADGGVQVVGVTESQAAIPSRYEPGNPLADANGYVYSSNVNPVDELVNMISASRSYQNNVEVMNSSKQMMLKTLTIGQ